MKEITKLTPKEKKRRTFILEGPIWKVMIQLTLPLAVYGLFNYLYGFFDLLMVAYIGDSEVASVVFIDEIKQAMTAFGAGIAAGGSVIVARFYGENDILEARKHANASFLIAIFFSLFAVVLAILFGKQLLLLLNASEAMIKAGYTYYIVQMITTGIMAINSVYMGLEKAKGNTKLILILNLIAMIIKLILSAIFVFGYGLGAMYVALATMIGQVVLMIVALFVLFNKNNSLRLSLSSMRLPIIYFKTVLIVALPVITGKFLFSMGKVLINSMAIYYGAAAVAALGIATKIGGAAGSAASVFEESEASVISQNLGKKNLKRAINANKVAHICAILIASVGMILTSIFIDEVIPLFTNSQDPIYFQMIKDIYMYERWSSITSSAIAILGGLFIGFKFTKVSFVLNVSRLFIFRLPLLFLFRYIGIDYVALGYIMFLSNFLTLMVAIVFYQIFMHRLKIDGYQGMYLTS